MTNTTTNNRPFLSITALAVSLILASLTGCQTMNHPPMQTSEVSVLSPSVATKQQLKKVLERQLTSSFTYNSSIVLSNAKRREALNNATPEQLNSADNKMNYCEDVHDKSYIALLAQAEKTDTYIDDPIYDKQRESLKNNYLNCDAAYQKWEEKSYEENAEEYLPNYDENHTLDDQKKENLINRHIIQPLTMNVTGDYQPLQGVISILPALNFNHRNLYINIKQPIYLDTNKGELYLWAETFAPLVSEYIDDEIGADWKDTWLKLTLHDGSLSKNIEKSLLKALIEAKKYAYEREPAEGFSSLDPNEMNAQLPFLMHSHAGVIKNTKHIIRRQHSDAVNKQQSYLVQRKFYELLTEYEPELFVDDETEQSQKNSHSPALTSKKLLNILLNSLKWSIDNYEDNTAEQISVKTDSNLTTDAKPIVQLPSTSEYFGLNGNQLAWWHIRHRNSGDNPTHPLDEVMHVDTLTVFKPTMPLATVKIDNDIPTPNASNSVDLVTYTNALLVRNETESTSDVIKIIKSALAPLMTTTDGDVLTEDVSDSADIDLEIEDISEDQPNFQEIDTKDKSRSESAECALLSVTIDTMCEPEFFESTDEKSLQRCYEEKTDAETIYGDYCQ